MFEAHTVRVLPNPHAVAERHEHFNHLAPYNRTPMGTETIKLALVRRSAWHVH